MTRERRIAVWFSLLSAVGWWVISKGSGFLMIGVVLGAFDAIGSREISVQERIERLLSMTMRFAVGDLYLRLVWKFPGAFWG